MTRRISVVVASRDRPDALCRCLTALSQLFHPSYEVIVAADRAGLDALAEHPSISRIRTVHVPEEGVALARNAGLAIAAGEIVAFLDDDAIPEPTWLCHLDKAFDEPGVGAATGYVLGRNGITYQWRARVVHADGTVENMPHAPAETISFIGDAERAVMTEGTNMAFRRSLLLSLGGFDSEYLFGFEDADIALRAAVSGVRTAIVPNALVHHGFHASPRRRSDRTPIDLSALGESTAVFLRRHLSSGLREALSVRREEVRHGLVKAMIDGRLEPRLVRKTLSGYDEGVEAGRSKPLWKPKIPCMDTDFRPFTKGARKQSASSLYCGWVWRRQDQLRRAALSRSSGRVATVICLSPTALFHRVWFTNDGLWLQTGGIFGKSERSSSLFQWVGFRRRIDAEVARVADARGIDETLTEVGVAGSKPVLAHFRDLIGRLYRLAG